MAFQGLWQVCSLNLLLLYWSRSQCVPHFCFSVSVDDVCLDLTFFGAQGSSVLAKQRLSVSGYVVRVVCSYPSSAFKCHHGPSIKTTLPPFHLHDSLGLPVIFVVFFCECPAGPAGTRLGDDPCCHGHPATKKVVGVILR